MQPRDEQEFREFVTARWHPLVRSAYLITGDHGHAEDLVQAALEKVHRRWGAIQRRDAPETYVRRAMVNQAISWRRRLRVREVSLTAGHDSAAPDDYKAYEIRDEVWRALATLPPRMRAALVLRYFDDLSEQETSRAMECSVGSVKSQTSRGLVRLREALGIDLTTFPAPQGMEERTA